PTSPMPRATRRRTPGRAPIRLRVTPPAHRSPRRRRRPSRSWPAPATRADRTPPLGDLSAGAGRSPRWSCQQSASRRPVLHSPMARPLTTPWPTTPGSVFFGDVASAATLSRAVRDGRIRRLARGLYSADLRADPAELVARNRWVIVARLLPDAIIAD